MTQSNLEVCFAHQRFANGYELVDGVAMHAENGERFQIPHAVLKKYIGAEQFVELRLDSPRFSAHIDAPAACTCQHCDEVAHKPILSHEHPASLVSIPRQNVPSRGWGEDFWVRVTARQGDYFTGVVDNPLYESRLHEVSQSDEIHFHCDHILAVHRLHREELVVQMDVAELKELAAWLRSQQ